MRVGLAGLGTVGQEVARVLQNGTRDVELVAVSARDKNRPRAYAPTQVDWESDAVALAGRDDIDMVVELIGGADGVAHRLAEASLAAGKHFVTANKAMLAKHAVALAGLAEDKGVAIGFEASVAAALPVIKVLRESLAGRRIYGISGILNGTCNFILSAMFANDTDFASALAEAQARGFAEADPSFDIGGLDAAQKLAIVSGLAFGYAPDTDAVYTEGITRIAACDIGFAREMEHMIRLVACVIATDDGLIQHVRPMLVKDTASLAHIQGETNAVILRADMVGALVLQGAGAGGAPTASAVLGDIMDIANGAVRPFFDCPLDALKTQNTHRALPPMQWYIRLFMRDESGAMAAVTAPMAEAGLSIESVIQRGQHDGDSFLPVLFITHNIESQIVARAIEELGKREDLIRDIVAMPIMQD